MKKLLVGHRDRDTLEYHAHYRVADSGDSDVVVLEVYGGVSCHGVVCVGVGENLKLSLVVSSCLVVELDTASQWDHE